MLKSTPVEKLEKNLHALCCVGRHDDILLLLVLRQFFSFQSTTIHPGLDSRESLLFFHHPAFLLLYAIPSL